MIDIPKDIQFAKGTYSGPQNIKHKTYTPKIKGDLDRIKAAVELMASAKKPLFYTGGGVINSGKEASHLLRELVKLTGFPITSTLMGLGAFPAADPQWLGMLGMHGTYEANWAMHDCDVMICVGARFDDRITGRLDAFAPHSAQDPRIDIDPSSINKTVKVDIPIIGDCAHVLEDMTRLWRASSVHAGQEGDGRVVEADRQVACCASRSAIGRRRIHQAAIRDRALVRADQGQGHLHHHRSRPASDVGGAVLSLPGAEPLDDIGRPRHDGLWPAGGGRRADGASEIAGHRHCRAKRRCR